MEHIVKSRSEKPDSTASDSFSNRYHAILDSMSSLYWANVPVEIENSARRLGVSEKVARTIVELVSSQIFGMLLYVVSIDLETLLSRPIPVIVQLLFNFLLFRLLVGIVDRFEVTPLPTFTNTYHGRLVKSLLLPTAGMLLLLSGGFVVLAVSQQYSIGISMRWLPILYTFVANSLFMLGLESFVRIGKPGKFSPLYPATTILLLLATLLTLGHFYLTHT